MGHNILGGSHGCGSLCTVLAEKMDHESSIFGLPPIPVGFEQVPELVNTYRASMKRSISMAVITACLERAKIEAVFRMERMLNEEGLEGFKSILNGDSIIDELAKVDVSCHPPRE
jgi:hypothetical protein